MILNKLIGDRGYYAQEMCHYLPDVTVLRTGTCVRAVPLR